MRLKIWNLFVVAACIIVLGTHDVDSLFDNICTSTGVDSIASLKNIRNDGISLEIRDFDPTGYIIFKVDAGDEQIINIALWGEVMMAKGELHVGTLEPIVGHAYVHGCDGYPQSTITNYYEFENKSQITYEWIAPNTTTISKKDTQNQSKRGLSHKQSHKCSTPNHHHHHHGKGCKECKECSLKHHKHCISDHDHKKHNHHNHKKHNHNNHKHNHHKHKKHNHHNHHGHKTHHKSHDTGRKKASKQTGDKSRHEVTQSKSDTNTSLPYSVEDSGVNPSNFSGSLPSTPFYFKGIAIFASNPTQAIVFSSDTMYINGNIPVDYDSSDFDTPNNDNNPVSSSAASFNNFKIFDINLALLVLLTGFSSIILF
ncbi:16086_t:CDS:2 [Dentiscutata erythropus]|uniref:16086_t:CDS:1 n=1 Tax=Dentiscutata erythropus TaxID=1348616 RepID=A0A9N9E7B3_9GLOM|nr:16086_t:CDS:2 [Dentiscutata erythropus]